MDRFSRRYAPVEDDQREAFQRDRDRILYSSAFRRLSGVTQIVRAGEADVFHNRLTHSLKVAQVGRRLAERCLADYPEESAGWGLDPEVVEAACMAHDLGHPPFGHVGEKTLCQLVEENGDEEGYEGNAQSFRVVTKLSVRFENDPGLDLTRATLAAILKYPWFRNTKENKKTKKWSVYRSESEDFEFARGLIRDERKCVEAELMDWADDIAYSVHDLEDFHRCGAIPWHLLSDQNEVLRLIDCAFERWFEAPADAYRDLTVSFKALRDVLNMVSDLSSKPYEGTRTQRQQIRWLTSTLIGRFIRGLEIRPQALVGDEEASVIIDKGNECEVRILKQITQDFILNNPALAAQQKGHQRLITELFNDFMEDIHQYPEQPPRIFPHRLRYLLDMDATKPRMVADCISSFTENEAIAFHGRLRGTSSGSVLDPIAR